jgi:MoaA/NifB/PqqE/SkfB family radical SAM enzyme
MTDKCNFKCLGCRRNIVGVNAAKEMSLTTVQKLLSTYPSIRSFSVAGQGEPTLCSNFVEIVDFLKEKANHVGVITNGTDPEMILSLKTQPDYVSISLYGDGNADYLAYVGVAAFDSVINNYRKLKNRLKCVGFSYIVTRENYRSLEKILQLCDKLEPDFLHLVNYLASMPRAEEVQKIITVKDREIIEYIDSACAKRAYVRTKPVYIDFDSPLFRCRSYSYKINLDGEGNVGGCLRQVPPAECFGNIFRDEDPFNSLEMRRLRRLMQQNKHPHMECSLCFGSCSPETGACEKLMNYIRAIGSRAIGAMLSK